MGLLVYPVFQPEISPISARTTGEFLAAEWPTLDAVAEDRGLKGLSDFADSRDIPEDFDGPPWALDEVLGSCEDWYDASAGRAAINELARLLRSESSVACRFEVPGEVIAELEDLARVLGIAHEAGARFRLALS